MNTYLCLFIIALSVSLFLTPVVRRLAQRLGWVDTPSDGRRLHTAPIPRLGGVAIFVSVLVALSCLYLVDNRITDSIKGDIRNLVAVLASSTLVFIFGLFDDLHG